jgi:nucleotide-binding universal stress UspA family protein
MLSTILIPTDGSDAANRALDWAASLARHYGALIVVLHVTTERQMLGYQKDFPEYARIEKIDVADAVETVIEDIAKEGEKRARAKGSQRVVAVTKTGDPASVIVEQAIHAGADLIVMGQRGLGPIAQVAMGSVSARVLQQAGCACLLVK